DPLHFTTNIIISDNFGSNVFTDVTPLPGPAGIDYSPTAKSLIASFNNRPPNVGEPFNFAQIYTNGVSTNLFVTNWSGIHGMLNEIKLATVKTSAAGFTAGDMYFGTGVQGVIGKLSADGTVSNLNFSTLTADTYLQGGLYVDDSGSFGGDLIAVTGGLNDFD